MIKRDEKRSMRGRKGGRKGVRGRNVKRGVREERKKRGVKERKKFCDNGERIVQNESWSEGKCVLPCRYGKNGREEV